MSGPDWTVDVAALVAQGRVSLDGDAPAGDLKKLLQVALANEVSVSELAASWVATTPELDVKLAFARQAGDEAGHFQLVADRLRAHGFDVATYAPPPRNPLFQYLASLTTTVERIAAGLVALEAIAYGVNENFVAYCRAQGDDATAQLYDDVIQPEEREHHELGKTLLQKYAVTEPDRVTARTVIDKVLAIATETRAAAGAKLGIACFPGC